jgi:hypothetical protein
MTPTDLINHLRQVPLATIREKLQQVSERHPEHFEIIENFILSCKPDPKYRGEG